MRPLENSREEEMGQCRMLGADRQPEPVTQTPWRPFVPRRKILHKFMGGLSLDRIIVQDPAVGTGPQLGHDGDGSAMPPGLFLGRVRPDPHRQEGKTMREDAL